MQPSSPSGCYWPSLTMQFTGTFSSNNFPSKHFCQRIGFLTKLLLFLKLDLHCIAFHRKLWEAYWQGVSIYWKHFIFQPLSAWEKMAHINLFLFYTPKVSIFFPLFADIYFMQHPRSPSWEGASSSPCFLTIGVSRAVLRLLCACASCTQPARPCSPPGNPQKLGCFAACTSSVGTRAFFCSSELFCPAVSSRISLQLHHFVFQPSPLVNSLSGCA